MELIQNMGIREPPQEMLESVCDHIINSYPKIRSAGIINDKGRLLAESTRKGSDKIVDEKEQEMLLTEIALSIRMRREHDGVLGPLDFTISYQAMSISMNFPLGDKILCILAEKGIDAISISSQIMYMLRTVQGVIRKCVAEKEILSAKSLT